MAEARLTTTDHDAIRQWMEQRGARPAAVKNTLAGDDAGVLYVDFPGESKKDVTTADPTRYGSSVPETGNAPEYGIIRPETGDAPRYGLGSPETGAKHEAPEVGNPTGGGSPETGYPTPSQ